MKYGLKYMGSKRSMLDTALGPILLKEARSAERFIDLFSGSAAVSWYVAERSGIPVVSYDLQEYATVLAGAVVCRVEPIDAAGLWTQWHERASALLIGNRDWDLATSFQLAAWERARVRSVTDARIAAQQAASPWTLTRAYGGHYYSPWQGLSFDALRRALPPTGPERQVALAALIIAASQCAASPGHTAQPFQPTCAGAQHLFLSWRKDPWAITKQALTDLSAKKARVSGLAECRDGTRAISALTADDVVFVDPPYSSVQYSRFYHVLESVARGEVGAVTGVGRYPDVAHRPISAFSLRSGAMSALEALLEGLAEKRPRVIVTFPRARSSNGLSGADVVTVASRWFKVGQVDVVGPFSTLGGTKASRGGRISGDELICRLIPLRRMRTADTAKNRRSSGGHSAVPKMAAQSDL